MKYRITPLLIGDMERFTVKTKDHWWNRWHFIFDGSYPRLFSSEDLKKYFKISVQYKDDIYLAENKVIENCKK